MAAVMVMGCGLVSLLGIVTNVINIIVFIKQKLKDSVNISLLALAIADFLCVVSMFWMCFSCSPIFAMLELPFNAFDITYMTGTWTRLCSNRYFILHVYRTASFINAFITLERCLCIALPLKVKDIITPQRTMMINAFIFIFMIAIFSPFYYVNRLEWRLHLPKNKTLLTLVFTEDKVFVETITFPIHSVAMSVLALVCVVVCTIILIIKLNKKSKWRQENATSNSTTLDTSSRKEQKVVKMVTSISVVFIVCYTPSTVTFVMMTCYPEFSLTGKFMNTWYVVWSLTVLLETINSSINIFIYFNMSSKFKAVILSMCPKL
ncbi:unnamed protein product [Candidula unifasciata]|uniref:G-protein coupled receptors family 1 profile domain-containing protein n=1 Tax=Candidula unifasciata TaxID=100452 RepID=A0A8S3ZKD7_9EUPU|nr:unnamed protein product [Candidula unifasciata]